MAISRKYKGFNRMKPLASFWVQMYHPEANWHGTSSTCFGLTCHSFQMNVACLGPLRILSLRAFPRDIIDHLQHPEAPPAGELVRHGIQRPARSGPCHDQDRGFRSDWLAARLVFTDGSPFLAVGPLETSDPGRIPLPAQQDEQTLLHLSLKLPRRAIIDVQAHHATRCEIGD